jgi:WD40 repeat protein
MKEYTKPAAHEGLCWCVVWDPRGKFLASCGQDKMIKIWGLESGKLVCTSENSEQPKHTRTARRVAWRPDSELLAVSSFDSTTSLWAVSSSGSLGFVVKLSGQENEVKGVSFSPCGEQLATCSRDKSIWIYDLSCLLHRIVSGSNDFETIDAGGNSSEEEFVFPTSPSVVQPTDWRGDDFECLAILQGHSQDVKAVKFNPTDSHMVVSVSYDDSIKVWRSTTLDDWELTETLRGHSGTVWDVAFNPECGSEFATVSADGSLKIWSNTSPQAPISASQTYLLAGPLGISTKHDHRSRSFVPVTESWSCQTLQLTSSQLESIPPPPVTSVDWGTDGLIAVCCGDCTVRIILRKRSRNIPLCTFKTNSEPNCVSICPRSSAGSRRLVAACFDDGSISVYEIDGLEDYM